MSAQEESVQAQSLVSEVSAETAAQVPMETAAQIPMETAAEASLETGSIPADPAPAYMSSGPSLDLDRAEADLEHRAPTKTRYMEMLLEYDQVPRSHNIIVASSTWVLLVGFILAPVTFTSTAASVAGIANIGLLWVSAVCCVMGGLGCSLMWFRWRRNYVWLLSHIFQPVAVNAAASLLAAVVNVYAMHQGVWSTSAMLASCVTGGYTGIAGLLFLIYNFWALEKVRRSHEREFDPEGWEIMQMARREEGFADKLQRKLRQKPTMTTGST
ncbi:hypothetical protein DV738_g168, partial [Chaetothyriales sp. CBS 135597]